MLFRDVSQHRRSKPTPEEDGAAVGTEARNRSIGGYAISRLDPPVAPVKRSEDHAQSYLSAARCCHYAIRALTDWLSNHWPAVRTVTRCYEPNETPSADPAEPYAPSLTPTGGKHVRWWSREIGTRYGWKAEPSIR